MLKVFCMLAQGGGELLTGTTGFFLGGYLTRRFKLTTPGLYKVTSVTMFIGAGLIVVTMFISCPQPHLIGTPG
jgi:uncharacterized membrane protein YeaQ/YmgE (transglycosylase-associated protein family)